MAARSTPEILAALDERGLLQHTHHLAAAHKVPIGDLVCPTSKPGRRARSLLFYHLHRTHHLAASVIATTFGVGPNVVWNDLYAIAAEESETLPPPPEAS